MNISQQSDPGADGTPAKLRASASNADGDVAMERLMASAIAEALDDPPVPSTANLHTWIRGLCAEASLAPPTLARFRRAFSAERARRKALVLAASERAVAQIGEFVGERVFEVVPGERPADRRDCELVVAAVTLPSRSPRIGEAWFDYAQVSSRAKVRHLSREAFRALVLSPVIIDGAPHEAMPDWWRKAVARMRDKDQPRG